MHVTIVAIKEAGKKVVKDLRHVGVEGGRIVVESMHHVELCFAHVAVKEKFVERMSLRHAGLIAVSAAK